jgi:hypothetical protein
MRTSGRKVNRGHLCWSVGTMRDDRGHLRSVWLLPFAAAAIDSLTLSMQTRFMEAMKVV